MPPTLTLEVGGPFVIVRPFLLADGSGPAHQQTTLSVRATESELIMGFVCEDTDAWGTLTERDDPVYNEECIEVFIAPGEADPVDYFEFEISPLGTFFDAKIHNPTGHRESISAEVNWDAKAARWTAIIAEEGNLWFPLLSLRWADLGFPDPKKLPPVWRVNFYRIDRPRDGSPAEFSCWSPTLETPANFHVPSRFGTLRLASSPGGRPEE
jgi:hypothetical protein